MSESNAFFMATQPLRLYLERLHLTIIMNMNPNHHIDSSGGSWKLRPVESSIQGSMVDVKSRQRFSASPYLNRYINKRIRALSYEKEHAYLVAKHCIRVFDQLRELHRLGEKERYILNTAALLHDVGKVFGNKSHHKASMEIIMTSRMFSFQESNRKLIALVARYHRGSMPADHHKYYGGLHEKKKETVRLLGGILRLIDSFSKLYLSVVDEFICNVRDNHILFKAGFTSIWTPYLDDDFRKDKKDLFESTFKRKVILEREIVTRRNSGEPRFVDLHGTSV